MTAKQRREYKAANQRRKGEIIRKSRARGLSKEEHSYWARTIGVIQDGTHTKRRAR